MNVLVLKKCQKDLAETIALHFTYNPIKLDRRIRSLHITIQDISIAGTVRKNQDVDAVRSIVKSAEQAPGSLQKNLAMF